MDELWEQFNLAENNPDRGGGILYCLRYSYDMIRAKREQLISIMKNNGIQLVEMEDGMISVETGTDSLDEHRKNFILFEELSVLNEAAEYYEAGLGPFNSVDDLMRKLVSHYDQLMMKKNLPDAYNFISTAIPEVISDLRFADRQNNVLSKKDRKTIEETLDYARSQSALLENPRNAVIFRF